MLGWAASSHSWLLGRVTFLQMLLVSFPISSLYRGQVGCLIRKLQVALHLTSIHLHGAQCSIWKSVIALDPRIRQIFSLVIPQAQP